MPGRWRAGRSPGPTRGAVGLAGVERCGARPNGRAEGEPSQIPPRHRRPTWPLMATYGNPLLRTSVNSRIVRRAGVTSPGRAARATWLLDRLGGDGDPLPVSDLVDREHPVG